MSSPSRPVGVDESEGRESVPAARRVSGGPSLAALLLRFGEEADDSTALADAESSAALHAATFAALESRTNAPENSPTRADRSGYVPVALAMWTRAHLSLP